MILNGVCPHGHQFLNDNVCKGSCFKNCYGAHGFEENRQKVDCRLKYVMWQYIVKVHYAVFCRHICFLKAGILNRGYSFLLLNMAFILSKEVEIIYII